jgi:hypothetical protein
VRLIRAMGSCCCPEVNGDVSHPSNHGGIEKGV